MSLRPQPLESVPEETARVARAAFPQGNPYLTLRDQLGIIFQDEDFVALFPSCGQPSLPPWRLALVTVMPFREALADRQAAEAVRARIDWKYLLGLERSDPGFDFSVLSEFRDRLLAGSAEALLLEKLLERCRAMGLLTAHGQQRTDSTHVLAAIRVLNRLELVAEMLRAALNELATVAPAWLRAMVPPEWYECDAKRIEDARLPREQAKREAYAQTAGEDGFALLDALEAPEAPPELRALPRRATATNGTRSGPATWSMSVNHVSPPPPHGSRTCTRRRRPSMRRSARSPSSRRSSPKTCPRASTWLMQPTSTQRCSSPAVRSTASCCGARHVRTSAGGRKSRGAIPSSTSRSTGKRQQVRCPQGKASWSWAERVDHTGGPYIQVRFRQQDWGACGARAFCTQATQASRALKLQPQAQYKALQAARAWYANVEGKQLYQRRAGVEGTLSQGVRAFGLRRTRYRGVAKTHLQHMATAAAINMDRLVAWLDGRPRAKTRTSRFASLAPTGLMGQGSPEQATTSHHSPPAQSR